VSWGGDKGRLGPSKGTARRATLDKAGQKGVTCGGKTLYSLEAKERWYKAPGRGRTPPQSGRERKVAIRRLGKADRGERKKPTRRDAGKKKRNQKRWRNKRQKA